MHYGVACLVGLNKKDLKLITVIISLNHRNIEINIKTNPCQL